MVNCHCWAKIVSGERVNRFAGIFPDDEIPIQGPDVEAGITGNEFYHFYKVDVARTTEEQKQKVAEVIAPLFNITKEEVLSNLNDPNCKIPLKDEGLDISICDLHAEMALDAAMEAELEELADDFEDDDFDDTEDEEY